MSDLYIERTVTRWGDLQPDDQIRYGGTIRTVESVEAADMYGVPQLRVRFTNGYATTRFTDLPQYLATPVTPKLIEIARIITPTVMLALARYYDRRAIDMIIADDDECAALSETELATVTDLVVDLADRADITITLPPKETTND